MNTAGAYTPLECLLLFQSIVAFGTEQQDFDRISNLLTTSALVKDGPTFDARRLTSEALRGQCFQLLREEVNTEDRENESESSNSTSKKRKIPSPPLPSIDDVRSHPERLSMLVDRLYARYRDYMVREIREEEKRFSILRREIEELERGEWDKRLSKDDTGLAHLEGFVPPETAKTRINGAPPEPIRPPNHAAVETPKPSTPASRAPPSTITPQPDPRIARPVTNDLVPPLQTTPSVSPRVPEQSRIPTQHFAPLQSHQAVGHHGPPPPPPQQPGPQHPGHLRWEPPYGAPNHNPPYQNAGQHMGHYPQHNSPQYANQPYPSPQRGAFPSPNGLPIPHATVPSSPGHYQQPPPILLPPSNAGVRPSHSPSGVPLDALADVAGQHYRPPPGSPMMPQPSPIPPPPPQGYFQPYSQTRSPSAAGPPLWSQQHPPPYQHPAQHFHGPPPPNQRPQFPPQPTLVHPENRQYNSPYNLSQGPRPAIPQSQAQRLQASLPSTPVSRGSPHLFTGSGTRWTATPTGVTPGSYSQLPRPEMEPLSPILRPSKSVVVKTPGSKAKATKPIPKVIKRGRAGSTPSSIIIGSRRSQSVTSHTDELSMDNEPIGRVVKEEVATPAGIFDMGDTTADDSTLMRPTSRAGPSIRPMSKRKRAQTISIATEPSTHVLWTRNFPNISKSALENISADKNANIFAKPVKEHDAPGYKNLILRPQDLKSIRAAIMAGHRAATAAAPEDLNPNATSAQLPITEDLIPPKGIINNAQLEKELMRMFANAVMFNPDPDRGFGKHWQALGTAKGDALGYAIDEDSVVKSTRAMFADVEKIVSNLRAAERRSEETRENSLAAAASASASASAAMEDDEVDELAGDGEALGGGGGGGHGGSVAKRRRKG